MTTGYGNYDHTYKPTKRENDIFHEELRNSMNKEIWDAARLLDTPVLMRNVDEDVITKCRLSIYGQQTDAIKRTSGFADEEYAMEKARSVTAGISASKLEDRLDPREIPLEMSLEELYFKTFGESSHGEPVPDKPNFGYICPCGLKMMMSWKTMRLHCPTCGRLTPPGKLREEGVLRR